MDLCYGGKKLLRHRSGRRRSGVLLGAAIRLLLHGLDEFVALQEKLRRLVGEFGRNGLVLPKETENLRRNLGEGVVEFGFLRLEFVQLGSGGRERRDGLQQFSREVAVVNRSHARGVRLEGVLTRFTRGGNENLLGERLQESVSAKGGEDGAQIGGARNEVRAVRGERWDKQRFTLVRFGAAGEFLLDKGEGLAVNRNRADNCGLNFSGSSGHTIIRDEVLVLVCVG